MQIHINLRMRQKLMISFDKNIALGKQIGKSW